MVGQAVQSYHQPVHTRDAQTKGAPSPQGLRVAYLAYTEGGYKVKQPEIRFRFLSSQQTEGISCILAITLSSTIMVDVHVSALRRQRQLASKELMDMAVPESLEVVTTRLLSPMPHGSKGDR
jgi:hypothetical protein